MNSPTHDVSGAMLKLSALWLAVLLIPATADLSRKPHARLWFPQSAETTLRERIAIDPLAAKLHAAAISEAEKILEQRTCRYEIPDGKRLLFESRRALHNIMHTSWAWRLGGEEKYRLRAIAELDAACALKDWNPSHFLDVAEMATAVATGYDWLYPSLTPAQRQTYSQALIEKALKPAKQIYDSNGWWSRPHNNWAQVCGAGIAIAAAAVAENEPELTRALFEAGRELIQRCGQFYQPDGMYFEGPAYWHYGSNYHVMFLAAAAALDEASADDPILRLAGDSIMHLTSPTRLNYNLPAYFGNQRWSYYRLQNRAHSTLEIDGKLQDPSAKPSPVTRSTLVGESYEATLDLSPAYAGSAANVIRHASFDAGTGATKIRDEVIGPSGEVVWRAFTDAKPEIRGDEVILRKKNLEITLRKSPGSGTWSIRDAKPPTTEENQNQGISVITLTAAKADRVKIEVEINP